MKKLGLLLVMAILPMSLLANDTFGSVWHRMDEPVKVKVRSVDFFIFPNGEFDFNAHQRHNRRGNYGTYAVRVERDRTGKIRRVGNVYLNYNRHNQVTRIGSVFIKYNRRGLVRKIGRKHLRYNGNGYAVVQYRHYAYYPSYNWNSSYYYGSDNNYYGNSTYNTNDYYEDTDDYNVNDGDGDYYYRSNGKKKKTNGKKKTHIRNRR
jgi:hypothetical protein